MARRLPQQYKKLVAVSLSNRFQEVVEVQTASVPTPGPGQLLVRNKYAGINASDINLTAGVYSPGVQPPLDTGLEGLGRVVGLGENCGGYKQGDTVGYMQFGAFSEYIILPAEYAIPVPKCDPHYLAFLVSGMTASIALEKAGRLKEGETVLVTAAAGGTGQFAVQLAKLAGCHVIGTCSTDEKAQFLRSLGCDRPINYKKEDMKSVLKREYPQGVNVVYESIGGDMFNTCVKSLAPRGRLILIGYISSYKNSSLSSRPTIPLYQMLLAKSASVCGFLLNHYFADIPSHFSKLVQLYSTGKLQCGVDLGQQCPKGPFKGLESVFDAVTYLYSRGSSGKVVVDLNPDDETPSSLSKL
jgi:NADPH-dependent curcumin reductase CurA